MNAGAASRSGFPLGVFFGVFVATFVLTMIVTVIQTAIAPEIYASVARVEVNWKDNGAKSEHVNRGYDIAKNEVEVIQSEALLQKVVASLDLNKFFGENYFNGEMLKTGESIDILRGSLIVRVIPNTTIVEVTDYNEGPDRAAKIVNAIVDAYTNDVAINSTEVQARILDNAYPGFAPVRPNKLVNYFIGVLLGGCLGGSFGTLAAVLVNLKNRNVVRPVQSPPQISS